VWIALVVAGSLVVAFVLAGMLSMSIFHARERRPIPPFASLADQPDASLQGTVAYTWGADRCVRVVAAAGQPSRDVYCLGTWQPDPNAVTVGKETNAPQLVWRADGRLEITMFRMSVAPETRGKPPVYTAGWQKVVDVRSGVVEDVPAAQLPPGPDVATRPTVDPSGRRLDWTVNGLKGQAKVTLTDELGSRTLLSAQGPGEYGYSIYSVFWAPNWQWIAADDGRVLVITLGEPPVTRVLVDGGGGWADFPTFAVTAQNLVGGSS
jgi:hypothetical protein